jgi:hypothetical protein
VVLRERHQKDFYEIRRITEENYVYSSGDGPNDLHDPRLVSPVVYVLVTNRYATYHELKYEYSIDDVIRLYEICMVSLYNRSDLLENRIAAERERQRK